MVSPENTRDRSPMAAIVMLITSLMVGLFTAPAQAAIVYISQSSGSNDALPTNGSAGLLTIPIPSGVSAGRALIASIAARPRSMTVTVPTGWVLMTSTDQPAGGVSTAPGGMTLLTYYKIATASEPASYTWTFANPSLNQGGSAVGGILAFSGVDTSAGSPIDVWSARLTPNGTTHSTNSITPTVTNTMIVSSISFLSSSTFGNPTGIAGITERLDVAAPPPNAAIGTTLQMSTAPWATTTATGASSAVAASDTDTGVGHLMALKSSLIDLDISMTRSGPLIPGGSASYTLTVINNGINTEPGPLTIVDTLPAGLTYASSSGSGWSCSPSGQTVTCTRASALLAGATAPALVLNVNVSAGASGTLTNTTTVSGTGGDGNLANNTAVDSYTIPTQTYAYYAMDEANWSGAAGQVIDSSGNNRHGTALGGITTLATPASGLKGDTCRGTNIPDNNSTGTIEAVNTGIDINNLGNEGTISFWYRSRLDWNTGNGNNDDRILFDATPNSGNGEFWMVLQDNGDIRFRLDNASNNRQTVDSGTFNRPAGTWVHVAATWSFTTNTMCVYVDGVSANCTTSSNITSTPNYSTLYIGDNRGTFTNNVYRGNSADGAIDEVRIYTSAQTAGQVAADMNAAHSCVAVDHYELSMAATSLTCLATPVTVTACADSSSPCASPYAPASGTTATLATTGGSLGSSTVTFDASGVATTTLSFPAAANGTLATVTLSSEALPASNPRRCIQGSSSVVANSCSTTFNTAGFIISASTGGAAATIPAQSAGVSSSTYYLRAVRTSTATQACEAALTGANTVNFAYECNNPTTCSGSNLMSVNGGAATTIARNNNGSVSSFLPVNMTFDANGNAPFTFNYSDVGQTTLWATKAAGGSLLSALSGSSNAFVVKPDHFVLSNIVRTSDSFANPGAADQNGLRFVGAGENFTVTATAVTASNIATPNYGKEIVPEGVKLSSTLVAPPPATGNNPLLANPTAFGAFTNGVATGTTFGWGEVGIITLTPSIGDGNYLGAGDVTGTVSGNVGRFTPAYFDITSVTHGCNSTFTYAGLMPVGLQPSISGQPFSVTATARNVTGVTTSNYRDFGGGIVFSKNTTISDAGTATNFTNNTLLAAGYSFGVGTDSTITYRFAAKETAPQTLTLRAVDTDNVSSAGHAELPAEIRSGRVHIINNYGPELLDLPLPMRAEYYDATSGWITNTNDGCTTVLLSSLTPANPIPVIGSSPAKTTNASIANPSFVAGDAGLSLSKPDVGGSGFVDLTANLSANTWLQHDWNGTGTAGNPTGRATFGIYRGSPKHIYQRERH